MKKSAIITALKLIKKEGHNAVSLISDDEFDFLLKANLIVEVGKLDIDGEFEVSISSAGISLLEQCENKISNCLQEMKFDGSFIANNEKEERMLVVAISNHLSKFDALYYLSEINVTELNKLKATAKKQLIAAITAM